MSQTQECCTTQSHIRGSKYCLSKLFMAGVDRVLRFKFSQPNAIVNSDAHVTRSQVLTHLSIHKLSTRFCFLLLQYLILDHLSSLSEVNNTILSPTID